MAAFTPLTTADLATFLEDFDQGSLLGHTPVAGGSVNSNFAIDLSSGRFFLRLYEEQGDAGARAEAAMLEDLAGKGVPTPTPVRRRDGEAIGTLSGKPAALLPWCDGTMRCQRSVGGPEARAVGEALARIHVAGSDRRREPSRFELVDLLARVDERIALATDPALAAAAPWLRTELLANAGARRDDLPHGLIHGDLFRDNVLWSDGAEIKALLDFESASDGAYAYDLAVTILAWCVGDDLDWTLAKHLVDGYQAVRPLSDIERAGLHAEACAAALRFTVTRITDYAMRPARDGASRVMKDWRRFEQRHRALTAAGAIGMARALA